MATTEKHNFNISGNSRQCSVNLGVVKSLIAMPEIATERIAGQRTTVDADSFTHFYQVWRTDSTTPLMNINHIINEYKPHH